MTFERYSAEKLLGLLADKYGQDAVPGAVLLINRWLARGDGAAVYENHDLSHQDLGDVKIASYGGEHANLELVHHCWCTPKGRTVLGHGGDCCLVKGKPPERLPDGLPAGAINWRYILTGTYQGPEIVL